MKTLFVFFLISMLLFSCEQQKEKKTLINNVQSKIKSQMQKDSLVLKKYVGGEPFMNRIYTEIEVAKNWGFIIQYTFGYCGGTYNNLIEKFKKENKKTKLALANKFGKNWETIFQDQVTFNLHPWYFDVADFDSFLKTDTLKLTTKKNKASLTFNSDNTCVLTFKTGNKTKYIIASSYHVFEYSLFLSLPNKKSLKYNIKSIKSNEIIMNRFKIFKLTRGYK